MRSPSSSSSRHHPTSKPGSSLPTSRTPIINSQLWKDVVKVLNATRRATRVPTATASVTTCCLSSTRRQRRRARCPNISKLAEARACRPSLEQSEHDFPCVCPGQRFPFFTRARGTRLGHLQDVGGWLCLDSATINHEPCLNRVVNIGTVGTAISMGVINCKLRLATGDLKPATSPLSRRTRSRLARTVAGISYSSWATPPRTSSSPRTSPRPSCHGSQNTRARRTHNVPSRSGSASLASQRKADNSEKTFSLEYHW